ncbi:CDP-alcohol phosphatidyltransferase family protein [Kocuria sp. JC486]|uniref:CDP-alcohol phosphatidyltransferase family protein n=1 Tax=Kocuria sp. JC486 TaxID=1970736 RepID=UPI00141F9E0C|nr:CDP-alcohol phosphatidyltransferase family protein [Kocuria sp. JC486]
MKLGQALRDGVVPPSLQESHDERVDSGVWTIPNAFTVLRFLLIIPAIVAIFGIDQRPSLPLILVAVFSLTDWVDGFLARLLNQYSRFGARLDPLADRLGLGLAVIALAWVGLLPWWAIIMIATVDLVLAVAMLALGSYEVQVTWLGKVRTALTMIGVVAVLAGPAFGLPLMTLLGAIAVEIGAVLHVLTGFFYLHRAWRTRTRFQGVGRR